MRITQKMLETRVNWLNEITGHNGNYNEKGAYTIDYAYGGVALHQYVGKNGAIHDIFSCGHITKKDIFHRV